MARHILVPMDGSPNAKAGLEHALRTYPDAEVTVLHVMAPYEPEDVGDPPLPTDAAESWYETAHERTEELFEEARAMAAEQGANVSTALEVGETWRTIVDYAEAHDVDHVVLGSHGHAGDSPLHLGSVAETVARRAPVTATVVR